MKIKPILTEKSLNLAKTGQYSFWVDRNLNKSQIKKAIKEAFNVQVTAIKTLKYRAAVRINLRRRKILVPARKKAITILKEGEKIDLFETKKKKTK